MPFPPLKDVPERPLSKYPSRNIPLATTAMEDSEEDLRSSLSASSVFPTSPQAVCAQQLVASADPPALELSFEDVTCFVEDSNKQASKLSSWFCPARGPGISVENRMKCILNHASGSVVSGEVLAIMGPSGSGKTSLLDILSGRKTVGFVTGRVSLNGVEVDTKLVRLSQAYVGQDDVLLPTLTVRETLQYIADLQIPSYVCSTRTQREAQVQGVIQTLGLEDCSDTKIGGPFTRGISGGQRRRVSIGIEFLTSPRILFMDEPTSGLDSAAALRLFRTVSDLALRKNMIIVVTIHQPRPHIFALFQKLLLLCEGTVAYQGKASHVLPFFASFGLHLPKGWNTADWLIDVIANPATDGRSKWGARERLHPLEHAERMAPLQQNPLHTHTPSSSPQSPRRMDDDGDGSQSHAQAVCYKLAGTLASKQTATAFSRQYATLLRRDLLSSIRNPTIVPLQSMGYVLAALFFGSLFPEHPTPASFSFTGAIILVFCFLAVPVYNQNRGVFMKEHASGFFRLSAYYMANLTVMLVVNFTLILLYIGILYHMQGWQDGRFGRMLCLAVLFQLGVFSMYETVGAYFPKLLVALSVAALSAAVNMLFNGVIRDYNRIGPNMQWIFWTCPLAYYTAGNMLVNFPNTTMIVRPAHPMDNHTAIAGCVDDARHQLVGTGFSCPQVVSDFGCILDLHNVQSWIPAGTYPSDLCPFSCDCCDGQACKRRWQIAGLKVAYSHFGTPLRGRVDLVYGMLTLFLVFWRVACYFVLMYCQKESR